MVESPRDLVYEDVHAGSWISPFEDVWTEADVLFSRCRFEHVEQCIAHVIDTGWVDTCLQRRSVDHSTLLFTVWRHIMKRVCKSPFPWWSATQISETSLKGTLRGHKCNIVGQARSRSISQHSAFLVIHLEVWMPCFCKIRSIFGIHENSYHGEERVGFNRVAVGAGKRCDAHSGFLSGGTFN